MGDDLPVQRNLVQAVSKSCAVVTRSQAKGLQLLPDIHQSLFEGGTKVRKDKKLSRHANHVGKARVQDPVPVAPDPNTVLLDPQ